MNPRICWLAMPLCLLIAGATWADGRPSGLRITSVVTEVDGLVQIQVSVPYATAGYYVQAPATGQTGGPYTAFLGNQISLGPYPPYQFQASQYTAAFTFTGTNVPRPYAIDWGDGNRVPGVVLTGPPLGPYTGTFTHTYADPGDYTIRVADAVCCTLTVTTGYAYQDTIRYLFDVVPGSPRTFGYTTGTLSIADTTLVSALFQTAIPALDRAGLLALALLLAGLGVALLGRRRYPAH